MATYEIEIEIKSKDKKLEFYETVFPRLNEFYENNYKTVETNKEKAFKYDNLVKKIMDKIGNLVIEEAAEYFDTRRIIRILQELLGE